MRMNYQKTNFLQIDLHWFILSDNLLNYRFRNWVITP